MSEQAIAVVKQDNFLMPAATLERVQQRYDAIKGLIEQNLKEGIDFGAVPGSDKPTLLKPGAEKLCSFFGLSPRFEATEVVEDWTGEGHQGEPFFYFKYKCSLYSGDRLIAEGEGSCNSRESKYRYRWVSKDQIPVGVNIDTLKTKGGKTSELKFAIERAETSGKYGKPKAYWDEWKKAIADGRTTEITRKSKTGKEMEAYEMDSLVYQIKNPDVADLVNTIQKMAQKRALIAPVLIATNTSERFTQDLDDMAPESTGQVSESVPHGEYAEFSDVHEEKPQESAKPNKGKATAKEAHTTKEIDLTPHAGKPTKTHIDFFITQVKKGLLSDDEMFGSPDKPGWLDKMGEKFTDAYFVPCIKEVLKRTETRELNSDELNSVDQVHKAWLDEIGGK